MIVESVSTWAKVRQEAALVVDKAGEIQRIVSPVISHSRLAEDDVVA
jgi:hypothetical protein